MMKTEAEIFEYFNSLITSDNKVDAANCKLILELMLKDKDVDLVKIYELITEFKIDINKYLLFYIDYPQYIVNVRVDTLKKILF